MTKNYGIRCNLEQKNNQSISMAIGPFFEEIPYGVWNACVGTQGDAENDVNGCIEAALERASVVLDKRLTVCQTR